MRTSPGSSLRRISAARRIQINMQLPGRINARRIATSVAVVIGGTPCRNLRPLGRLGKLPAVRDGNAALGGSGHWLGKGTSWRRWAGVVRDPIRNLPSRSVLPDIFSGNDRHTALLFRSNAGAINAGAETCRGHLVHPGIDIRLLHGQHPSAFFLVEKDDRAGGESFVARG